MLAVLAGGLVLALAMAPPAAEAGIKTYAIVQDDATLRMRGLTIRLFGVHIPSSERVCETRIRPVRCGERAARALRFKIQGFVDCAPQARYADGSIGAICTVGQGSILDPPLDLGAWLIGQGLAVAAPGAPFDYTVVERIARSRGRGIWGFEVEALR